jgi:hypothetical protein
MQNSTERRALAQIAAHESWARTVDRSARTASARRAAWDRFERLVDPDNQLTPAERAPGIWYPGEGGGVGSVPAAPATTTAPAARTPAQMSCLGSH